MQSTVTHETHPAAHRNPQVRRESIAWARGLLANPSDWVVLDTETTGLKMTDEVIQIGIVVPDGTPLMDTLVHPVNCAAIPRESTAVHGITMDALKGAPTYSEIAARLEAVLDGKRIVAYNAEYDRRMLRQSALLTGARAPHNDWECAMIRYSRFVGEWDYRKSDYRYQRLPSGDHSAVGDCRATLKIIQKMASAAD